VEPEHIELIWNKIKRRAPSIPAEYIQALSLDEADISVDSMAFLGWYSSNADYPEIALFFYADAPNRQFSYHAAFRSLDSEEHRIEIRICAEHQSLGFPVGFSVPANPVGATPNICVAKLEPIPIQIQPTSRFLGSPLTRYPVAQFPGVVPSDAEEFRTTFLTAEGKQLHPGDLVIKIPIEPGPGRSGGSRPSPARPDGELLEKVRAFLYGGGGLQLAPRLMPINRLVRCKEGWQEEPYGAELLLQVPEESPDGPILGGPLFAAALTLRDRDGCSDAVALLDRKALECFQQWFIAGSPGLPAEYNTVSINLTGDLVRGGDLRPLLQVDAARGERELRVELFEEMSWTTELPLLLKQLQDNPGLRGLRFAIDDLMGRNQVSTHVFRWFLPQEQLSWVKIDYPYLSECHRGESSEPSPLSGRDRLVRVLQSIEAERVGIVVEGVESRELLRFLLEVLDRPPLRNLRAVSIQGNDVPFLSQARPIG